ncbi:unnamed protein product [Caenorhabditis angaria]|uniref:Uncharacterized protein n=1 Tax=Caenorhabditis angaria TaxID=860376 RepID=A0A9P1IZC4_9PELO|nr:unnamed protein product [Caenorhabditis angaria]
MESGAAENQSKHQRFAGRPFSQHVFRFKFAVNKTSSDVPKNRQEPRLFQIFLSQAKFGSVVRLAEDHGADGKPKQASRIFSLAFYLPSSSEVWTGGENCSRLKAEPRKINQAPRICRPAVYSTYALVRFEIVKHFV